MAIGVTPTSLASRRIESASSPCSSAMAIAASTSASRVRRGAVLRAVDRLTIKRIVHRIAGRATVLYAVHVHRIRRELAVSISPPARTARSPWLVLAVLAVAQFIDTLDVTIVNVGLPHIRSSLHFGAD